MFFVFFKELFKQCLFFTFENNRIDMGPGPCHIADFYYLKIHAV